MAEEQREHAQEQSVKKSGLLPLLMVAVVALVCGVATPFLVANLGGAKGDTKANKAAALAVDEKIVFIEFGAVTVNLDSDRLNRFLNVDIALQIRESHKKDVEKDIETNKYILMNWLNSFLANQQLDEIRGATGQNRLRREIRNQFNMLLYRGGVEKIEEVLFKNFNVQ